MISCWEMMTLNKAKNQTSRLHTRSLRPMENVIFILWATYADVFRNICKFWKSYSRPCTRSLPKIAAEIFFKIKTNSSLKKLMDAYVTKEKLSADTVKFLFAIIFVCYHFIICVLKIRGSSTNSIWHSEIGFASLISFVYFCFSERD
jgi:hypothetical protein